MFNIFGTPDGGKKKKPEKGSFDDAMRGTFEEAFKKKMEEATDQEKKMMGVASVFAKAKKDVCEMFYNGDEEAMCEDLALGVYVKGEKVKDGEYCALGILGSGRNLFHLLATISMSMASHISEENGISTERAMMKITGEVMEKAAHMIPAKDAGKQPMSRSDMEQMKEAVSKLSIEDIENLLGE